MFCHEHLEICVLRPKFSEKPRSEAEKKTMSAWSLGNVVRHTLYSYAYASSKKVLVAAIRFMCLAPGLSLNLPSLSHDLPHLQNAPLARECIKWKLFQPYSYIFILQFELAFH